MKRKHILAFALALMILCFLLAGCSRLSAIKLPPLPTPSNGSSVPAEETLVVDDTRIPEPSVEVKPMETPAPTAEPEPTATPEPTPEPTPENPNIPHLTLSDATYPEDMPQYSVADLLGEIVTDKGLIIQVWAGITDLDGNAVQACVYYPYESYFNLADTVNAELRFGMLKPGKYLYQLKVIAENHSYYTDETLIDHPFEIFFP